MVIGGGRGLGCAFAQSLAADGRRLVARDRRQPARPNPVRAPCASRHDRGAAAAVIINIASGGGATMLPYFSAYVTSEAALICFAECLAAEVKPHCIAVFAIRPGNRSYQDERVFAQFAGRPDLTSPVPRHLHRGPRASPRNGRRRCCWRSPAGRADALSGCFPQPSDDLERIIDERRDDAAGKAVHHAGGTAPLGVEESGTTDEHG